MTFYDSCYLIYLFSSSFRIHGWLRVRLTIRLVERRDKTLILGERYYNLFIVTDVGIINFDKTKAFHKAFLKYKTFCYKFKLINCVSSVKSKFL